MDRKKLSLILLILWMIVIFTMSSFNANDSGNQSGIIVNFISNIFNISNVRLLSLIVRKLAHFTEYFILGVLSINYFIKYKKNINYSFLMCVIYAISDEIHQIFVSGRSCQLMDIFIDSVGAIIGIIFTIKFVIKN